MKIKVYQGVIIIMLVISALLFILSNTEIKVNKPSLSNLTSDEITELHHVATIRTNHSIKQPFEIYQVRIPSINATCLIGGYYDSFDTMDCKYD